MPKVVPRRQLKRKSKRTLHVDKKTRRWIFATLLKRSKDACEYCGEPMAALGRTIDHVIPLSKGGTDHLSNLKMVCRGCNQAKGAQDLDSWLAGLEDENGD